MAEQLSNINPESVTATATATGKEETGTSDAKSDSKMPNILANSSTCRKFCALYEECLSTIVESFPECKLAKNEYDRYMTNVKGNEELEVNMIKKWHKDMIQNYTRADSHDNTLWESMPLFSNIDVSQKVKDPDLNSESVDIFWEYIDGMNRHSRMYNAIPENMFDKIQSQAMQYKDKLQNGELNIDNMNWGDIQSMGEQLMGSINQSDIAELTSNLSGLAQSYKIQSLDDIFKLVADIPGLGETAQNLNSMGVTNMIDQVVTSATSAGQQQSQGQQPQPLQFSSIMSAMGQMMNQVGTGRGTNTNSSSRLN